MPDIYFLRILHIPLGNGKKAIYKKWHILHVTCAERAKSHYIIRDIAERNGDKNADSIDHNSPNYNQYKAEARKQYLAICFLQGADRAKYGNFVTELENDYTKGTNHIPSTVAEAYGLLDRIKLQDKGTSTRKEGDQTTNKGGQGNSNEAHGLVFVNKHGKQIGKEVICYECGSNHYKGDPACPNSKISNNDDYLSLSNSPHLAFLGAQPAEDIADRKWIQLDNQSSENIFKISDMVNNITRVPPIIVLLIHSNGDSQYTFHTANYPDVGIVWYNPRAITNILSFSKLKNAGHQLVYDYNNEVFTLCINNPTYKFQQQHGLYIYHYGTDQVTCGTTLTTVNDNSQMYTPRQIECADKAHALYRMLGRPSDWVFKQMLNYGLIHNTDVTAEDVSCALDLYGPDIGELKGKTVRSTPSPVTLPQIIALPDHIKERHSLVTLCADICHVDGLHFLTTISRHLHFGTIEFTPSTDKPSLLSAIKQVISLYHSRGFTIQWILTDRAFKCLRNKLHSLNILLNVTATNEHVPEIERFIRVIKERIRAYVTTSPIQPLPNIMKIHLIQHSVQMLNLTIQPNSVSDTLSPSSIVLGTRLDAHVDCKLEFGTYCQVHEEPSPSNNVNDPRTLNAISLHPIGNAQGGYYFLCLTTWRVFTCCNWTTLPMPQHVIDLVQTKARDEQQNCPSYLSVDYFHFWRRDRSTTTRLSDDDSHLLLYPFVDNGDEGVTVIHDEDTTDPGADQGGADQQAVQGANPECHGSLQL